MTAGWLLKLVLSLLGTLIGKYLLDQWQRRQKAQKYGCLPIIQYPNATRLGPNYDQKQAKATQEGRLNRFAMEQYDIYQTSTYEVRTLGERMVISKDISNYQTLATQLEDWEKERRPAAMPFLGNGIVNQNGLEWRHARNLVNPLFKRAELLDVTRFKKFVDCMITVIPRSGQTVDMQQMLRKLFLDSSSEFIFGKSIDSLQDTTGEADKFIAAFNRAMIGTGKRARPTGVLNKLYYMGSWDRAWAADCKIVHDYVDKCISLYRASSTTTRGSYKQYLLIEGMSKEISDPVELRFQLLNIFYVARETSAVGFANVLFLLARNPQIWKQLRTQALALDEESITFETLQSLTLFRHTVLEAFRLHSPITRNRRIAARDTVLPRGGGLHGADPAFVRKGTIVWADSFPTTRDPKIWGDDVEAFRPARFEGRKLGWDFTPFSGGPRICPANQQVILQCVYLLVRLTREFETLENRDSCLEYLEGVIICFESKNGCKVALHPPEGAGKDV